MGLTVDDQLRSHPPQLLGGPHGQALLCNLARRVELLDRVLDCEQRARMAHVQLSRFEQLTDGFGQVQQAEQIRDGCP